MGKRQSQQGNFQCGYPKLQNMWMTEYFLADTETERQSFKRQLSVFCQNEYAMRGILKYFQMYFFWQDVKRKKENREMDVPYKLPLKNG